MLGTIICVNQNAKSIKKENIYKKIKEPQISNEDKITIHEKVTWFISVLLNQIDDILLTQIKKI